MRLTVIFFLISLNTVFAQKTITYDFSCMEDDATSFFINLGSDFEKELLQTIGDTVTMQEEHIVGDSTLAQMKKEYTITQSGLVYAKLNGILQKLILQIKKPKGFRYEIYLIESSELNAFTIGGKIFFTSGMFNFCKTDDEIACIIGHEIAHNELGHINDNISRVKTANNFGTIGQMSASIGTLLTMSFNQKNEVHSDFIGIDLAIAAGYNGCASVALWKRMKEKEGEDDELNAFFNTHPYSGKRASCSKNHLSINYSKTCSQ